MGHHGTPQKGPKTWHLTKSFWVSVGFSVFPSFARRSLSTRNLSGRIHESSAVLRSRVGSQVWILMGVSKNNGTQIIHLFIGFSIINHPFWVPLFLETSLWIYRKIYGPMDVCRCLDVFWCEAERCFFFFSRNYSDDHQCKCVEVSYIFYFNNKRQI